MPELEIIKLAIGAYTAAVLGLAWYLAQAFTRKMAVAAAERQQLGERIETAMSQATAHIETVVNDLRQQAQTAAARAETAGADLWQAIDLLRRELNELKRDERDQDRRTADRREDMLRDIADLKVAIARLAPPTSPHGD